MRAQKKNESRDAFASYGAERLLKEFKYIIEIIEKIVEAGEAKSLRALVFENKTTNAFPTVFSTIFLTLHELSFKHGLVLANPEGAHASLKNVHGRLNTDRGALSSAERRNNVNSLKGLLQDKFVTGDVSKVAHGARREMDIENTLRRSQIETPSFELKQGILRLDHERKHDQEVIPSVMAAMVAIANIGPKSQGAVFVGVADEEADADRIRKLDGIEPVAVGHRWVVGIDREAAKLNMSAERYFQLWRDSISNSDMSEPLKSDILANLDLVLFRGMHLLIVTIPSQRAVSLVHGRVWVRDGDQTKEASPEKILSVSARFMAPAA